MAKRFNLLKGSEEILEQAWEKFSKQPVDADFCEQWDPAPVPHQQTIREPVTARGTGTFSGRSERTVYLEPAENGWWLDRRDLPDCLPTEAVVHNVWTTGAVVRNIVLRSGPPENYIRMVEHMVALKLGLGIDNLVMRFDSGDPPLFENGSWELVEAVEEGGIIAMDAPAEYITVKEPVGIVDHDGSFLMIEPCDETPKLTIDCAVDFPNAIGCQRIRFPVCSELFKYGVQARTNTTSGKRLYCRTIGKLFADIRNLGYTDDNILVAGRKKYVNEPGLLYDGKSLEVAWHRAALDLLAAFALLGRARFVGKVISYKAGHKLDVKMMTQLLLNNMLTPVQNMNPATEAEKAIADFSV